jgi:hypothetical protein
VGLDVPMGFVNEKALRVAEPMHRLLDGVLV